MARGKKRNASASEDVDEGLAAPNTTVPANTGLKRATRAGTKASDPVVAVVPSPEKAPAAVAKKSKPVKPKPVKVVKTSKARATTARKQPISRKKPMSPPVIEKVIKNRVPSEREKKLKKEIAELEKIIQAMFEEEDKDEE